MVYRLWFMVYGLWKTVMRLDVLDDLESLENLENLENLESLDNP